MGLYRGIKGESVMKTKMTRDDVANVTIELLAVLFLELFTFVVLAK